MDGKKRTAEELQEEKKRRTFVKCVDAVPTLNFFFFFFAFISSVSSEATLSVLLFHVLGKERVQSLIRNRKVRLMEGLHNRASLSGSKCRIMYK